MVKEKKTSPEKEPLVLTEWQKRNIEFIEKRRVKLRRSVSLKKSYLVRKKLSYNQRVMMKK